MIRSIYLNHKLSHCTKYYKNFDYQCEKCGIILFYDEENPDDDEYQYNLCLGNAVINPRTKCILTCEEYIIKQIIE